MANVKILKIILFFLLFNACQKDDAASGDKQEDIVLELQDEQLFTSSKSINNGKILNVNLKETSSFKPDYSLLDIKNVSNNNVDINFVRERQLLLKTNQGSDQQFSFDIFYDGELLKTLTGNIKVLFNLEFEGRILPQNHVLTIAGENELKAFKLKSTQTNLAQSQSFDYNKVFFYNVNNELVENYNIYKGDTFKVTFNNSQSIANTIKVALFYNFNSELIFVRDFDVKFEYTPNGNCQLVTSSRINSRVGVTPLRPNNNVEYYIKDGVIISSKSLLFSTAKKQIYLYNNNDKLVEIFSTFANTATTTYSYNSKGLLKTRKSFNSTTVGELRDFNQYYYNENNNLTAIATYVKNNGDFVLRDSLTYSNFENNNAKRVVNYLNIDSEPFQLYYKVDYDQFGNNIKQDISVNDIDYVLHTEAAYHLTEKQVSFIDFDTGETLVEKPVLLYKIIYSDIDAKLISTPVREELKVLEKDSSGNTITIENSYTSARDGEISFLFEYTYQDNVKCN